MSLNLSQLGQQLKPYTTTPYDLFTDISGRSLASSVKPFRKFSGTAVDETVYKTFASLHTEEASSWARLSMGHYLPPQSAIYTALDRLAALARQEAFKTQSSSDMQQTPHAETENEKNEQKRAD